MILTEKEMLSMAETAMPGCTKDEAFITAYEKFVNNLFIDCIGEIISKNNDLLFAYFAYLVTQNTKEKMLEVAIKLLEEVIELMKKEVSTAN